ncbi:hypothetical protein IAR55_006610 [Kwoniella newhampshirensis]|uniref:protein-tyrosine-phosphatase n=1 Tax=Kwoniella newhampshirensis TaxID=1651941 RepID=A0AAW0YU46_9TREE
MPSASRTTRDLPRSVAIFNDRFIFTVLDRKELMAHGKIPYHHPETGQGCLLFSLDDEMAYASFAMDHGPLNLAFTYQACLRIHERLEKTEANKKPLCLYTSPDPKTKSNMTLVVALWALLVAKRKPWEAFKPIAQFEVMPFRDAGNGEMDYGISIQDVLYGIFKAVSFRLLDLSTFDINVYRYFESVDNGDLNVLGSFIPFASPVDKVWVRANRKGVNPPMIPLSKARSASHALSCVLKVFEKENVGLVVRLNDELYDRRHFLDVGIDHFDLYFDDGSNPSDEIVREFIKLAEETIEKKQQKVAVHCKAGLGRTGVLIGAYLIYKYQFTAQEAIGYMRIMRPGMVVGPQQQYMAMKQMTWAGWAARDQVLKDLAEAATKAINPLATPPTETNALLPSSLSPGSNSQFQVLARDAFHSLQAVPKTLSHSLSATGGCETPVQKGGDAIGQPRKTPGRTLQCAFHNVEHEQEVAKSHDLDVVMESASQASQKPGDMIFSETFGDEHPSSSTDEATSLAITTTSSSQDSMRGIKRAAGRSPLRQSPERVASPSATLNVPVSLLSRSCSSASTSSISSSDHDPRPPKRRSGSGSGSSPPAGNGLSSPPPSREGSPASERTSKDMVVDAIAPSYEVTALTRLRKPMRLRRRISPTPSPDPQIVEAITPPATVSLSPSPNTCPVPPSAKRMMSPPKRSFLPVRRNIASSHFMDLKTVSFPKGNNDKAARAPYTASPSALVKTSTPRRGNAAPSTPKRGVVTPPRLTGMWGQLSKLGSSSPASGC